ncbi:MAG TPA: hypothetical protein VK168_18380 [Saprospiraceae bacterium]|nr:hypothetical protein [Saprospiraceae bacterium]
MHFRYFAPLGLLLFATALPAQTVWQFFSARYYHDMPNGSEKSDRIRDLEYDGWKNSDTLIDLDQKQHIRTVDLSPLVDEMGEAVFLVSEVSPEFPGGKAGLQDYLQNYLGDLAAGPSEGAQNMIYIKFVVQKDGSIQGVSFANPVPDWISPDIPQRCLSAVEQMPPWTPGTYRGRPVKVAFMIEIGLK